MTTGKKHMKKYMFLSGKCHEVRNLSAVHDERFDHIKTLLRHAWFSSGKCSSAFMGIPRPIVVMSSFLVSLIFGRDRTTLGL